MRVDLDRVRQLRAEDPGAISRAIAERRPGRITGRMVLIAADHPARGTLAVGGRPLAMAHRGELLERLVVALERPGVDGVLGSPDVIDELLLAGALDGKVVIGSLNRGGLTGAAFEVDDRYTGYDAPSLRAAGFDGGKILLRIALEDPATAGALEAAASVVSNLATSELMAMIEPFMARWESGRLVHDLSPDAVIKSIGIASALGVTTHRSWLKLPVVEDMARVMESTTLPTLLLGGDPTGPRDELYARWQHALALPGVRGLVVGRALLFPDDDDVVGAVDTAVGLVKNQNS